MAYGISHFARGWDDTDIESTCPCGKAACGLVDSRSVHPKCPEHSWGASKTIRQSHKESECSEGLQPRRPVRIFPTERKPMGGI